MSEKASHARAPPYCVGHSKLERSVRYLGVEVEDAVEMAEQTDVGRLPIAATVARGVNTQAKLRLVR